MALNQKYNKDGFTIITTHINADFDALASMLAAQKLYPDALVVFPGSHEKNLRNFFVRSMAYLYNMTDIKDIDLKNVKRLVIVDTKQPDRIGKLAELLERRDVEIHIYDHHPAMANDIIGHYEVNRLTGAAVTILLEIIKKKGIDISPDEATVMALGIYEDTGSFNFSSTTEKDFMAAAFLLSKKANLNVISSLIAREEISPEQVGLLNDMIQTASHYNINGIDLVVVSVSKDHYVADFALLVHKMVKMENINAIFAIARMGKRIYVIARSRITEVNAGKIVSLLGGGGHTFAAAATIRNMTLAQVEHKLFEILYRNVTSRRLAKNLMSSPPIMIGSEATCSEAGNILTRYNINALLIKEKQDGNESLSGFITRQIVEKALYHHLDHVPVREYMNSELSFVGPDSDLSEIQDKIINNKQRILPVIEKGAVTGVITRTDLLNVLVRKSQENVLNLNYSLKETAHVRSRNISKLMQMRLSKRIINILKTIGKMAGDIGYDAYVVGGFVRDMFLHKKNDDIDIVIEGDGIAFAKKYSKIMGARVHSHEKFGTAVIIFNDGFKIDIASARTEYYKSPAALPTVEMSSIKLDLFRRDFTINTLAIRLNPENFGVLIDFFSAQRDIKDKVIRVLNNLSFVEDPTRVFRAIKFEQRFGFSIGKLTSDLIKNAVKMNFFKQLSSLRFFSELRQILEEENPENAFKRLNDYGMIKVIHPNLIFSERLVSIFKSTKNVLTWHNLLFLEESYMKWIVYFLALTRECSKKTTQEICKRLELPPRYLRIFSEERFRADKCILWLERNLPVNNSLLYKRLSEFKTELILYMMASAKQNKVKRSISHYFTQLRNVKPSVTGNDLKTMGFIPGPIYREILQAVLNAKLDGRLKTRSDELCFVRNYNFKQINSTALI